MVKKILVNWLVTPKQVWTYREEVIKELVSYAKSQDVILDEEQGLAREILPSADLGKSTDEWKVTLGAADAATVAYSGDVGDRKVMGIYGIVFTTGVPIYKISFKRGSGAIPVGEVNVEDAAALGEYPKIGIFEKPFLLPANSKYAIEYYAKTDYSGADAYIKLLGITIERLKERYAPDSM